MWQNCPARDQRNISRSWGFKERSKCQIPPGDSLTVKMSNPQWITRRFSFFDLLKRSAKHSKILRR